MISANVPNKIRRAIYQREGYACALCGDPRNLHIHHVIPRANGGGNSPHNLIALCRYCHALVHGVLLGDDMGFTPDDVEQSCVEYVSDMYAGKWHPLMTYDYENPDIVAMAICEIDKVMMQQGRRLW